MSKKVDEKQKRLEDNASLSLETLSLIFSDFKKGYSETTPKKIKLMDAFCLYCFIITIIQIGYCFLVGSFPMNSFLAGVFTPLGSLIITGFFFF